MTLRQGLIIALVLAVAGAIGYWFYANFEKERKDIDVGFLGAARYNPLLAAQRYIQSFGVTAHSEEGLTLLPPAKATLLIPSARYEMGGGEAERLRRWVEAGGHLVLVPSAAFDEEYERADRFLDPLGIEVKPSEEPETGGIVDVDWPGTSDFITIKIDAYVRLDASKSKAKILLALADEDGAYLIRLAVGKGEVTVLSDANFLTNYNLDKNDHAAYLWRVLQLGGHGNGQAQNLNPAMTTPLSPSSLPQAGERDVGSLRELHATEQRPVWLVFSDGMPPLHRWLMQHALSALISGAVLLLLWLWAASRRFGPLRATAPLARRRLLDHIAASGRFLWRAGQGEQLLKGVRRTLYRALELRHPAWAGLASQDLYQRLAALSGLSYEEVQGALLYTHLGSEHEFTQAIQTLERIRKSL